MRKVHFHSLSYKSVNENNHKNNIWVSVCSTQVISRWPFTVHKGATQFILTYGSNVTWPHGNITEIIMYYSFSFVIKDCSKCNKISGVAQDYKTNKFYIYGQCSENI